MLRRLDTLDTRLFHAAARRESPVLDRVLPTLTSSADHGLLWYGVAGLLAVAGRRRAAVRGLASLAVASAVAN
ncbi:MAG: phosphoesterase, partial [Mycobacteriales bacterium]